MSDDRKTAGGWQRVGLAACHYFLPHQDTSLCGEETRREDLPVREEPDWTKCLVCFAKKMALPPQPELF